jgi:hypothetical protein
MSVKGKTAIDLSEIAVGGAAFSGAAGVRVRECQVFSRTKYPMRRENPTARRMRIHRMSDGDRASGDIAVVATVWKDEVGCGADGNVAAASLHGVTFATSR